MHFACKNFFFALYNFLHAKCLQKIIQPSIQREEISLADTQNVFYNEKWYFLHLYAVDLTRVSFLTCLELIKQVKMPGFILSSF